MNREKRAAWLTACLALTWSSVGVCALGCVDNTPKNSSSSNWLDCKRASCVDAGVESKASEPVEVMDGGSATVMSASETQASSDAGTSATSEHPEPSSAQPSADTPDAASAPVPDTDSCTMAQSCDAPDAAAESTAAELTTTEVTTAEPNSNSDIPESSSDDDAGPPEPSPPNDDTEPSFDAGTPLTSNGNCVGAVGEWIDLPPPDEGWASDGSSGSASLFAHGAVGGYVYVWDFAGQRLFELDVCQVTWTVHDVDWPTDGGRWEPELQRFIRADVSLDPVTRETQSYDPPRPPQFITVSSLITLGTAEETLMHAAHGVRSVPHHSEFWFSGAIVDPQEIERTGLPFGTLGNLGLLYDSASADLLWVNTDGAPSPRAQAIAIPVDGGFMVWGGFEEIRENGPNPESMLSDGAIYHVATDSWTSVSEVDAPVQPLPESAYELSRVIPDVLSTEILFLNTAPCALYNPATDSWRHVEGADGFWLGTNATPGFETAGGKWVAAPFDAAPKVIDLETLAAYTLDVPSVPPGFEDVSPAQLLSSVWRVNTWAQGSLVRMDASAPTECPPPEDMLPCAPFSVWHLGGGILRVE